MEWQTLRIIDQQRHRNIIDVIAFYSWRGELNCVFPFVELNLHDVLHSSPSWKPEALAQPKRFPNHWLWLQMLGVADALKTIHNPPKQLRPDLGKIVGFHFDLKPSNILVTPNGTLKVTDFGQSMVKMVQENEDVYGTFVGGDFAYGPPETCPSRIRVKALRANELRSTSSTATVLPNSQHHRTLSIPTPPSTVPSRRTSSIVQIDPLDQRRDSFFRAPFRNSTVQPLGEFARRDSEAMSITAPSTAATSTASEDSGLTATANYDVWSLACIMTEVLDFIFLDGAAGVKRFEQARRDDPSERDLSFHNGSQNGQLKGCVHQLLNGLRDMDSHTIAIPGQPLTYMSETVGVLYEMFNPEPKFRLSSDQVVERFESITEKHKEDDDPNSNIIRYMKELGPPDGPGFKEHGYVREKDEDGKDTHDTSIVPFYNMPGIRFEINAQTIVDCRIQLFRRDGAVYFRVCYGDPFRSDKSHYFSTNSSFYCPLYLFDPAGRFMCSLSDQNVTRTLYFKTGLDLMTFQTAIMRHEALRGVKVSGVALHPKTRPKEIYNNLFDQHNPWPRCQFWKAKDPQYVLPRSSTASIKSPTQTPARARIVFFFGPASQSIFGIPLQDGKKKIFEVKDDGDAFDQPTRRIKFGRPDGFNKYFHYLKPNAESPRSPSSPHGYQQPCPLIPMNSTWLITDESKTATRVDVAFTDHDGIYPLGSAVM
jgi:serine/threonine protein kinase